jgi:PAS domain S-box-containing protein
MPNADELTEYISQSALANLLSSFGYPATITDSQNRFVYANPAFLKRYGYQLSEILGLSPRILTPRNLSEHELLDVDHSTLLTGWEGVLVNQTKQKKLFPIFLRTFPVRFDSKTKPTLFFGISCDPKQKKKCTDELADRMLALLLQLPALKPGQSSAPAAQPQMGKRQREVQRLLALGYSYKEIAAMVGISVSTVRVVKWKLRERETEGSCLNSQQIGRKPPPTAPSC